MKKMLLTPLLLLALFLSSSGQESAPEGSWIESVSVPHELDRLESLLLPPKGSTRAEIEAVFGKASTKKDKYEYYPLLAQDGGKETGNEWRLAISVFYEDEKLALLRLDYPSGIFSGLKGSRPSDEELDKMRRKDDRNKLADLEKALVPPICEKLRKAPWVKNISREALQGSLENVEYRLLQKFIIPGKGTPKEDIEKVYPLLRGSSYELIPDRNPNAEVFSNCVILQVKMNENKLVWGFINDIALVKGLCKESTAEELKRIPRYSREIDQLHQILVTFEDKLFAASWNQKLSKEELEKLKIIARTARIGKTLLPPYGTRMAELEEVYGEGKKHDSVGLTTKSYELLPQENENPEYYPCNLSVYYENDGKVSSSRISWTYESAEKGFVSLSCLEAEQTRKRDYEKRLSDFKKIGESFADKLKKAAWNRIQENK